MKKLILLFALFLSLGAFAQAPEGFKYQAVLRDGNGEVIANQNVNIRISVLQGSGGGSAVYQETHAITSNDYGIMNLNIGSGTVVSGTFNTINWGANAHFVQVEIDQFNNGTYTDLGASQLLSVPYALYAKSAPADGDGDANNEIQVLSFANDTIFLSNGGGEISLSIYTETFLEIALAFDTVSMYFDSIAIEIGTIYTALDDIDMAFDSVETHFINVYSQIDTIYMNIDSAAVLFADVYANLDTIYAGFDSVEVSFNMVENHLINLHLADSMLNVKIDSLGTEVSNAITIVEANLIQLYANDSILQMNQDSLANVIANLDINDADADPTNEIQNLTLNGSSLGLSGSSATINLAPFVGTNTDEQTLSVVGDSLFISNGNAVQLPVGSANTDNQTLSIVGDSLFISNGNAIQLPATSGGNSPWMEANGNVYRDSGRVLIGNPPVPTVDKVQIHSSSTFTFESALKVDMTSNVANSVGEARGAMITTSGTSSGTNVGIRTSASGAAVGNYGVYSSVTTDATGNENNVALRGNVNTNGGNDGNAVLGTIAGTNGGKGISGVAQTNAWNVGVQGTAISNANSTFQAGVEGFAQGPGTTLHRGGYFRASGAGSNEGLTGIAESQSGNSQSQIAVLGEATGSFNNGTGTGQHIGVYGRSIGASPNEWENIGVKAEMNTNLGSGHAINSVVYGNNTGKGAYIEANTDSNNYGIEGYAMSNPNNNNQHIGIIGSARGYWNTTAGSGFHVGVRAEAFGNGNFNMALQTIANGNGGSTQTNRGAQLAALSNNAADNIGGIAFSQGNIAGPNYGFYGFSTNSTSNNTGIYGTSNGSAPFNAGVDGTVTSTGATNVGVGGYAYGANTGGNVNYGVYGYADAADTLYAGYFDAVKSTGYSIGLFARTASSSGKAGIFEGAVDVDGNVTITGNLNVTGNIAKGGGTFKIDHPLDPANKNLIHSFVESNEMMNVYSGNITTDANGIATVNLPDYFEAANQDFRYQLTVIGSFSQAIIKEEVKNNAFVIQTSDPMVKVSWQITAVRADRYANAHRIVDVEEKATPGKYIHPELYNATNSKPSHRSAVMPQTKINGYTPQLAPSETR